MRPAWCWRKRGVSGVKHEAELTVAPRLLAQVPLGGTIITGDALYCQRALCAQIVAAGGDYLFFVKGNQPTLEDAIRLIFDEPPPGGVFPAVGETGRHGDRHEDRRLTATTALTAYLDWPGVQQVGRLTRQWHTGTTSGGETRHFITSLDPAAADPATLLRYGQGHWRIENRLHYVRDVTLGEDASRVRSGAAPEVLAALRNAMLTLLRHAGVRNVADTLRAITWQATAPRWLGIDTS